MGASTQLSRAPGQRHPAPCADERFVRRHLRGLWRFVRLLGASPSEADDLTQETFLIALRKGTGDRDERQVAAFLRATARHVFLRNRRLEGRRARRNAALAEEVFARSCADDGGDARVEALGRCVEQLGPRGRSLVRLFYGERRSRTEVAEALDMKETGVKTALQRVRQSLRACAEIGWPDWPRLLHALPAAERLQRYSHRLYPGFRHSL